MRKFIKPRSRRGSYTVETALILPILILAMLTLGYYIKVQMIWENVMNGAIDETRVCAAMAYDGVSNLRVAGKVKERITSENEKLEALQVEKVPVLLGGDGVKELHVNAKTGLALPLGWSRDFKLDASVRYREFIGNKSKNGGMGREALETGSVKNPVIIFPQEGEKYHREDCTYVKATVSKKVLTGELKREYSACGLCKSGSVPTGDIVYCFRSEGSAYHRSDCKSINRFTITIDKDEAIDKGYTPCSKCGGQ